MGRRTLGAVVLGTSLALAGCGGDDTATTAAVVRTPSASLGVAGNADAGLLRLGDLPSPYEAFIDDTGETPGQTSTGDAGCRALFALQDKLYDDGMPDQTDHAGMQFQPATVVGGGGQLVAAFSSSDAAKKAYQSYLETATACRQQTYSFTDGTSISLRGGKVTGAASVGDESTTYRYQAVLPNTRYYQAETVLRVGSMLSVIDSSGPTEQDDTLLDIAEKAAFRLR